MTPGNPPHPHDGSSPDDLVDHPDLDTLADLDAGLLDPADAARAGRHASSCSHCRTTLAAFVAVRRDLRLLAPPVLPEDVAARLDATVARLRAGGEPAAAAPPEPEAPPRDGLPEPGPAPPPEVPASSVVPPRPPAPAARPPADLAAAREERERRRVQGRRLTGRVAASVIVAAALVGVGTAIVQHADDNGSVATSAAIPNLQTDSGGRGNGGSGGDKAASGEGAPPSATVEPRSVPSAVPSYDDEGSLLSAIPLIAARSGVDVVTSAGLSGPAGPMADIGRRSRCTTGIPGMTGTVIAVQRIRFENQTAYVFIFADLVTGGRSVVVVSADCGEVPAPQVLYRHTG